jgi:hypothetical protein
VTELSAQSTETIAATPSKHSGDAMAGKTVRVRSPSSAKNVAMRL